MTTKRVDAKTGEITGLTLVGKLARIMTEVEPMKKGGENSFQHFKFIEVNAMMDLIRPKMAAAGIMLYPVIRDMEMNEREKGKSCHTVIEWVVTDGVETLDPRPSTIGEANDTSDKAANKAQTAALKQLYMKLFQISAEDDNDAHDIPAPQGQRRAAAPAAGENICPEHGIAWRKTTRGNNAHPVKDGAGRLLSWCDEDKWRAGTTEALPWEPEEAE